jgi:eukaryotic-like serine/threonine-protein kinase
MQTLPPPPDVVLEQLDRMLASDTFAGAERSRVLLRFLVEHVVDGRSERLKEYTIGSGALGRGDSFDPRTDTIVRAEASRLRARIERYYATSGAADTVLITLPKGSYVPQFERRTIPEAAPVVAPPRGPLTPGRLHRLIWFVLGGVTVGVALFVVAMRLPEPRAAEFGGLPFEVKPGTADYSFGSDFGNDVIISPDGTRMVFVGQASDRGPRLMMLKLDEAAISPRRVLGPTPGTVVRLQDTEAARAPFFSPEGLWVGFWDQADRKLKKVSVHGGSAIALADAENFGGASWGENGDIIAAIGGALRRVPQAGASTVIADLAKDGTTPRWPDLLPGGEHVLFTVVGPPGPDAASIEVLSLSDGTRKPLPIRAAFARYLSPGYLLYVNQGTLFASRFDRQQLTVHGTGVPVLDERVAYNTVFGNAKFDISRNGVLIYRGNPPLTASWLNRGGGTEPLLIRPGAYTFPRLSPDGQHLAINVSDSGVFRTEIHDLRDPDEPPIRPPFSPGSMSPVWHPNGFLILGGPQGMSWMKADDMSTLETLTKGSSVQIPWSFNADGTRLAYAETSPSLDLWTIPVSDAAGKLTAGEPEPFLRAPYVVGASSFSPDGRWMLFASGSQGQFEVYVQAFSPDGAKAVKVSQAGGRAARWLSNGREIVYRTDDHRLMIVDYQVKDGTFITGTPVEWTPERLGDTGVIPNFDVHRDRVLGLVPASRDEAERARTHATVIPDFVEQVRRRLARGGK